MSDPQPDRLPAVVQAPRFGRAKKRLPAAAQLATDGAVKEIMTNPLTGEPKTGALKGVRVLKFKVKTLELLLAYQFDARRKAIEVLDAHTYSRLHSASRNSRTGKTVTWPTRRRRGSRLTHR